MEPTKTVMNQDNKQPIPKKTNWDLLLGAAFLMATSAIGPGFLTQTTVFTQQLAASFGFVILMSIILDIGAQMNVWRIIAVSEKGARILPTWSSQVLAIWWHY